MALEVNEIGIRMHVRDGAVDAERGRPSELVDGAEENTKALDRDDIVAECVRRVLRTLKTLQER